MNLPDNKSTDINHKTLVEILQKQNLSQDSKFHPYNKSILTRLMYRQLKEKNVLTIVHMSKKAISQHFDHHKPLSTAFTRLGFEKRVKTKKITAEKALKILDQNYHKELEPINSEIRQFRDGRRSMQACSESIFNQMLQFLVLRD